MILTNATRSLTALAILVFLAAPLAADSLADAFAKMDASAAKFKGMTADLQRTDYTALAKDTSVATGDIKLRRVKEGEIHMLVTLTRPDQEVVAFDGKQARIYFPKTNVEQVYDVAAKKDMVEQVMLLGFGATSPDLKAHYDVTFVGSEAIGGQPAAHLKLIPKSPDMLKNFRQVELWISDSLGVPLQQKFITSTNGDFHQFTYSNLKLTGSLSDKDLQLKTPKNVQIKQVGQ
jgi:outer membrane lipoprotein-sorting protein